MIYSKLKHTNIQDATGTPVTPRVLHVQEPDKLKIVDSSYFQYGDILDAKSTMDLIGKGGGTGVDMKMLQDYINKMTIEYDPATKSVKLISPDGVVIGTADMSSIATEGGVSVESGSYDKGGDKKNVLRLNMTDGSSKEIQMNDVMDSNDDYSIDVNDIASVLK